MLNKLSGKLSSLWSIKPEFRSKVFFQALTFLLMSACLVIWRPLKVSIFAKIVGSEFVPSAKLYSLFFLVPLILAYSKLVDILRRHQLLYCFTIFHGIGGLIFYFLLSHPVYGIANTDIDSGRLVGWFFYFFMESFNAFLSTVFWSFADSINNPKDAKNFYGFFVSGSKIGSIISAGLFYFVLTTQNLHDSILLPNSLLIGSLLLFAAAGTIYFLMKKVPGYYMHGYEAVYQLEKKRGEENKSLFKTLKSSIEGLILILKNPYVLGIFSLVLFYEVIIVIFDYRVLRAADTVNKSAGSLTAYYALYYLIMNLVGLVISFFGTTPILRLLGARVSLLIFPIVSMGILLTALFFPYAGVFFATLVGLRALNYALNHPTREVLYIPTTKDIKFKAKAWTDAFGSRISKGCGSVFNISLKQATPAFALMYSLFFSLGLVSAWLVVVFFLGKTLQNAINNKTVIGQQDND
jgi:ATP:ADP antiporter, AAA family